jgi:eukaryotic-like serine/threonine-protein kinase
MPVDVTQSSAAQPGRLIDGRYRLGGVLGSGGAAEVIRAVDERLDRAVAVKLFRGDVADQLQRHEEEMRTLARLAHAGLVTVFDAGTDDETQRPYLVMQLVEGSTLAEQLRRGPLPAQRTAQIGASLADALAYVHDQGLVHRDVKPANVLIGADSRVHLADFGIARIVDSAHVTRTGDVLGTPAYFAPEQVSGEPVGPAADVYALGLIMLECLTGRREYDGSSIEVAMARLNRQPEIPTSLPGIWQDLLAGMTARDAAARISAEQAADRLRRISAGGDDHTVAMAPLAPTVAAPMATSVMPMQTAATSTMAPPAMPPPDKRGSRAGLVALLVIVVLVAAVAVVVGVLHHENSNGSCVTATPRLTPHSLETDMRRLERLICTS